MINPPDSEVDEWLESMSGYVEPCPERRIYVMMILALPLVVGTILIRNNYPWLGATLMVGGLLWPAVLLAVLWMTARGTDRGSNNHPYIPEPPTTNRE